jgi:hypothetical protein
MMTSKTAEFALDNLCRSLGQAERNEQLRRMNEACDSKTLADIVADNRNSVFLPSNPAATVRVSGAGTVVDGEAKPRGSGWQEVPSIDQWKPPGLEAMDALVDQQDRIDKAKLARELSEAARVARQLERK